MVIKALVTYMYLHMYMPLRIWTNFLGPPFPARLADDVVGGEGWPLTVINAVSSQAGLSTAHGDRHTPSGFTVTRCGEGTQDRA